MATPHQLPSDIISLIHHVELHESGWWEKAITQVIKGVMWKHNTPLSILQIKDALHNEIGYAIADKILGKVLAKGTDQNFIIKIGEGYKLTEATLQDLSNAYNQSVASQKSCEESFFHACQKHTPNIDPEIIWKHFKSALHKNIKILGANLYHLISDGKLDKECDWFTLFLSRFDENIHTQLKQVITDFFSPNNKECRHQLLQMLCAHFFAEATQLNDSTIKSLESNKKSKSLKIALDTNFIFSILQLHDNPGNEPSISLIEIAESKKKYVDLKLYVLPSTLDEAKNVITNQKRSIEKIRTTRAMSRAASSEPLPSIAKKFMAAAEATPGLTADIYFDKYITSLEIILKNKGITILDAHPAIYSKKQEVIDDIIDEQAYEETHFNEEKRKTYETLQHDIILWHAVNDRRPGHSSSPFEIEYWAVSNDWRLIDFDRRKHEHSAARLPVVLHPSNLIQFLQFWVPRSEKLDNILVDSLNLPIYFNNFDHADEKVTVIILTAISHYKNNTDLSEEIIKEILTDKALKQRIKNEHLNEKAVFELVHKNMLKKYSQQADSLIKAKEQLLKLEEEKSKDTNKIINQEEILSKTAIELEKKKYLEKFIYAPIIISIALMIAAFYILPLINQEKWFLSVGILSFLTPLIISSFLSNKVLAKNPEIENWIIAKLHHKTKVIITAAIVLALTTSFQEIIAIITTSFLTPTP